MTVNRAFEYREGGSPQPPQEEPLTADPRAVLGAVREDIRQTLRTSWVDPALDAASAHPVFFTAAWSAIRPNVGKSFLLVARALRTRAMESARAMGPSDLRKWLEQTLSETELRRVEDTIRATHLAAAKSQIVVHALSRSAQRERIVGTGREEPPTRRGVPDWQRWIVPQPVSGGPAAVLDQAAAALNLPGPPMGLRLLARWPDVLGSMWGGLVPHTRTEAWTNGVIRLRRIVGSGVRTLPHPMDLQWPALRARGVTEEERMRLAGLLAEHDAGMAAQTLLAAYVWTAIGSPDVGVEG